MTDFHEDRYFDPDPTTRNLARELYESTRALPIVSPHGHVEAAMLAANEPFADPASLIVTPDHYILRLLYSRGVSLESVGVRRLDDTVAVVETDPRKIWRTFAEHWHMFRATPTQAGTFIYASQNAQIWLVLRPASGAKNIKPGLMTMQRLLLGLGR